MTINRSFLFLLLIVIGASLYAKSRDSREENGFWGMTSAGSVTVVGYSGEGTDLRIPAQMWGLPVVEIGSNAFAGRGFTSVAIPDSVARIQERAFYGNQLTDVAIPASVVSVGLSAFAGNPLTKVWVPDSLVWIADLAFGDARVFGSNGSPAVGSVGEFRWSRYGAGVAITAYAGQMTGGPSTAIGDSLIPVNSGIQIPLHLSGKPVTGIGDRAFFNSRLASISIPSGVVTIGIEAFASNFLVDVVLPDTVISIGDYAF